MTIILAAALILTVAGFLVLLDRRDQRERAERQTLLQRIQAPEIAVAQHANAGPDPDGMPMTDEQQAEAEERARALSFIEQFETA